VSVINGNVSSSTLVEVTSLPWLRTPQENDEQPWKWKKSSTKRKYSENKLLNYTTISTKLKLTTEFLVYSLLSYSLYYSYNKGMAMAFIEGSYGKKWLFYPSSATRDNPKHETSVFCSGNQREDCFLASDWVFWRALQKQFLGKFDRSTFISIDRLRANIRSIEF
jgi:hypothetical protein